jgi:hypothetical protein
MKIAAPLLLCLCFSMPAHAQTATLRGQVVDETGAVVPGAKVTLTPVTGGARSTTTDGAGLYSFPTLALGDYTVRGAAPELAQPEPVRLTLHPGAQTLDLHLKVASSVQHVTVQDSNNGGVSLAAAENASAVVLREKDLDALSDNPEDLLVDLQALAGPAAGPNGGAIYVDASAEA